MRHHLFGKTGPYVCELCLGTMTFGGKGFWEVAGQLGAKEVDGLVGAPLEFQNREPRVPSSGA